VLQVKLLLILLNQTQESRTKTTSLTSKTLVPISIDIQPGMWMSS